MRASAPPKAGRHDGDRHVADEAPIRQRRQIAYERDRVDARRDDGCGIVAERADEEVEAVRNAIAEVGCRELVEIDLVELLTEDRQVEPEVEAPRVFDADARDGRVVEGERAGPGGAVERAVCGDADEPRGHAGEEGRGERGLRGGAIFRRVAPDRG